MKSILVFLTLCFIGRSPETYAQSPVKWEVSYLDSKTNTLGDSSSIVIMFNAHISDGWHLYATKLENNEGPIPTEFVFENKTGNYVLDGEIQEQQSISKYDPNFDMKVNYFEKKTVFTQSVKLVKNNTEISGYISYMVCDDEKCLPPTDEPFKLIIN